MSSTPTFAYALLISRGVDLSKEQEIQFNLFLSGWIFNIEQDRCLLKVPFGLLGREKCYE